MTKQGGIQLPDDSISVGYVKVRPFEFAQVFYSPKLNFRGTEKEFIAAGHAYEYRTTSAYTRLVLKERNTL